MQPTQLTTMDYFTSQNQNKTPNKGMNPFIPQVTRPPHMFVCAGQDKTFFNVTVEPSLKYEIYAVLLELQRKVRIFNKCFVRTIKNSTILEPLVSDREIKVVLDAFNSRISNAVADCGALYIDTDFIVEQALAIPPRQGCTSSDPKKHLEYLISDVNRVLAPIEQLIVNTNLCEPTDFSYFLPSLSVWKLTGIPIDSVFALKTQTRCKKNFSPSRFVSSKRLYGFRYREFLKRRAANNDPARHVAFHTQANVEEATTSTNQEIPIPPPLNNDPFATFKKQSDRALKTLDAMEKESRKPQTIWEQIISFFKDLKAYSGDAIQYLASKFVTLKELFNNMTSALGLVNLSLKAIQFYSDWNLQIKLIGLALLYVIGYAMDMLSTFSAIAMIYAAWAFENTALKVVPVALSFVFTSYRIYGKNTFSTQAGNENFENCPVLLGIVSIIGAASLGSASCLLSPSWITNTMKHIDIVSKSWNGVMNIADKLSSLLNKCLSYIGLERFGFNPDLSKAIPDDIEKLAARLTTWAKPGMDKRIQKSKALCNEIYETMSEFTIMTYKYKAYPALALQLQRIAPSMLALYNLANLHDPRGQHPRSEPVTIYLYGQAGSGKSRLVYPITAGVMKALGEFEGLNIEEQKEKLGRNVFSRKSGNEFWDGYADQYCTVIDDAFQEKDVVGTANKDWMDVINMSNLFPFPLNMAHVEKKGTTMFTSKLVILTSNMDKLKPESLVCPSAIQRRIGHSYEVRLKEELFVPGTRKLKEEHRNQNLKFDWYEFRALDLDTGCTSTEALTYREFLHLVVEDAKRKAKYQSTDLDESVAQDMDAILDDAIFSTQGNTMTRCDFLKEATEDTYHDAITDKAIDNIRIQDMVDSEESKQKWKEIYCKYHFEERADDEMRMALEDEIRSVNLHISKLPLKEKLAYLNSRELLIPGNYYITRTPSELRKFILHPIAFTGDAVANFVYWAWQQTQAWLKFAIDEWLPLLITSIGLISLFLPTSFYPTPEKTKRVVSKITKSVKELGEDISSAVFGSKQQQLIDQKTKEWNDYQNRHMTDELIQQLLIDPDSEELQQQMDKMWEDFVQTLSIEHRRLLLFQSGKSRSPPKRVTQKPAKPINTQGWSNTNAESISEKAAQNMRSIKRGKSRLFHMFIIGGHTFVINQHIKAILDEEEGDVEVLLPGARVGTKCPWESLKWRTATMNGEELDLVIGKLPTNLFPKAADLTKHLVRFDDLDQLNYKSATLHTPTRDGYNTRSGEVRRLMVSEVWDISSRKNVRSQYIELKINTTTGDCGGFYLTDSKDARRIFGIHGAGADFGGIGLAVPIFQELFISTQAESAREDGEQIIVEEEHANSILQRGQGNVLVLGAKTPVYSPTTSKIIKTRVHGKIITSPNKPAKLCPPLLPGGPMLMGLEKQFGPVSSYDPETLMFARHSYEKVFENLEPRRMGVLDFRTAVQGIENSDYYKPINRSRSAGYPWCLQTKRPGKTEWFGSSEWTFGDKAREVEEKIKSDIEKMEQGEIIEYIFLDTLKDETRPISKVDAGKTRVFAAAPMDFIIVFRMYFLDFLVYMMENRIHNESAVGIRAQSEEWLTLHLKLGEKGRRVIAGDFSNYDGSLHPAILWAVFDVILGFYARAGATEQQQRVRRCLWNNIVYSYHLCGSVFYQLNHAQPSGNPSTAILNSMYNSIVCRYIWYMVYPSCFEFRDYVSMIAYGDDNVLNVSDYAPDYDQDRMAFEFSKLNMIYTDEGKSGDLRDRTLEEVAFLKRSFRYDRKLAHSFAPLELISILDCFNWIHKTDQEPGVMVQNAHAAFVELSMHDKNIFDEYSVKIVKVLKEEYGLNLIPMKYKEYRRQIAAGKAIKHFPELEWV